MYNDIFRPKKVVPKTGLKVKGAGSKYSFRAIFTNFGNSLLYPYAKQKGADVIDVKVTTYGLGFDNYYSTNGLGMGYYNIFTETMTLINSDEDLHSLEIARRGCRMASETDGLKVMR